MATEPTLGQRILEAAKDWEYERTFGKPHSGFREYQELCALAARADAAERLAKATVAWFAAVDGPTDEIAIGLRHADIDAALAAYRARMAQGVGDAPVA